ncbi:PREDICTED: amino-acid permease [Prunus dulcis]|uniref:PREDICTED: amino-acid permease n=1 Tax=Prunus dulcis TaxID=3755 RepID=A0A5E4EC88_PRUDU|nr:PREDICTED: amino-acid permease [Prunus dulcis]
MQVVGGLLVIVMLPLVAQSTQPASYVFTHFETSPESTGVSSIPYAVILSVLLSIYSLFGYDAAAHLTEETKGAEELVLKLFYLVLDLEYLYNADNETAGALVGSKIQLELWFSCVYALSRDNGIPFSPIWRKLHPRTKVPTNAVWLCAAIVPIFARLVMAEENFKPGPFYLGRASRPVCLVAFLWICYACSAFLLPTFYPLGWKTFNYAPVAVSVVLTVVMLWWALDARNWFKGPVRNIDVQNENY